MSSALVFAFSVGAALLVLSPALWLLVWNRERGVRR